MIESLKIYRDYGSVDIKEINKYERNLRLSFPDSYKILLSKHNAAWLSNREFDVLIKGKLDARDIVFCGYGDGLRDAYKIAKYQQMDFAHEDIIVIGKSCEGDYICFDYRFDSDSINPPVVLMLHDYQDEDGKLLVCPIADEFESFLKILRAPDD